MKVILISLDTLCASHVSCYGHPFETTPCIDRWAEEAVVFERCYASDVPTPPSYTAMLSGRFGIHNGIFGFQDPWTYRPGPPLLQEHLGRAGWETCAISNLFYVCPWLQGGWRTIMPPGLRFQGGRAPDVTDDAIGWLEFNRAAEDAFLFVHYWEPHCPYNKAPEEDRRLFLTEDYEDFAPSLDILNGNPIMKRYSEGWHDIDGGDPQMSSAEAMARYDAQTHFGDREVGRLLDYLEESGQAEETAVIITSDHGEAFGEYGSFDHHTCYECISHVPLMVRLPGGESGGRRVEGLVYGADLTPTVLELAGMDRPELDGRSLVPCLTEGRPAPHDFIVTDCNALVTQRMLVKENWGLVRTYFAGPFEHIEPVELFDVTGDPERNLAAEHPAVVADLRALLDDWLVDKLDGLPDRLQKAGLEGGWTLNSPPFLTAVLANLDYARQNEQLWEILCHKHGPSFGRLTGIMERIE